MTGHGGIPGRYLASPFASRTVNATDEWYDVANPEPGVWTVTEGGKFGSQIVVGDERALLIDAGAGIGDLRGMVEQLVDVPVTLLLTHAHWDHVGNGHRFEDVIAHPLAHDGGRVVPEPLSLTPAEWAQNWQADGNALPDGFDPEGFELQPVTGIDSVYPGTAIDLGGRTVELLATPGHAAEGLSVLDRRTGSVFVSDVVHTDYDCYAHFPGGDLRAYRATLSVLVDLFDGGAFETVYFSHVPPLSGDEFSLVREYRNAFGAILADELPFDKLGGEHPARRYRVTGNEILAPTG
jgi:glyoxylase-like metal-dependent hydrolase (beta-lactamase superfamily II)